jgi:DNA polymerase-3 subunit alpha
VKRLDPASELTLETLPLDDKAAYDIFRTANAAAVFQFESRGMRDLITQAPPTRFEDIIALVALYRPGPMELIPTYTARKTGRESFEYPDRRLEPILSPTHGIMIYQEQVMQIAQVIGGYTLGAADLLRRAMGKKNKEEMAKHRDIFIAGAEKNGLGKGKASALFDLMEKFAGYGFNKSHAAAYALIAYQTAYMKAHHPAAFMAANLSLVMDDTDKVRALYDDARDNGLAVLPPDVNSSNYRFEPVDRGRIRYGLGGIKGTGEQAIEAIVAARQAGGPFRDLFDFCRRIDKRHVNRRAVEALVKSGAFDAVEPHRAMLFASVGIALSEAEKAERSASQVSLFGDSREGSGTGARRRARMDGGRAPRARKDRTWLLSVGHPYNAFAPELAPLIRLPSFRTPAEEGSGAHRRNRHVGARPVVATRKDGHRHAGRRRRRGRGRRLQRDLRLREEFAARRSARDCRGQDHAAHERRRTGAGPAHRRGGRPRSSGRQKALCQGTAPCMQRWRRSRAPRRTC